MMENPNQEKCPACEAKSLKLGWYKEKLFITALVFLGVLFLSYALEFLNPLFGALVEYIKIIWWAILIGLVIGGIIDYFIPEKYITKYLAQPKKRTVFYSVFLGFLVTACSHGILAIAIELYKKGASVPSVIAFLLASPWANLPVTVLLFGFFGWKALLFVVFAIIIAMITGLIYQSLDKRGWIEKNPVLGKGKINPLENCPIHKDSTRGIKGILRGSWTLAKMVLWWILIGMILASVARAFIPHGIFTSYMGATLLGLLITLVVATIIEVCSEGSAPLAFEIFRQTGAFGGAFVFLMAGVITDVTEIGLIWTNIGKKSAIWLPIITVPQVVILGYLFNLLI